MNKHSTTDQTLLKMPSLRAVKCFVAAARHQSFTRAAEALCVTQAAVSRQIRELEEHLGTELFDRVGRSVRLTTAGAIFFEAAQLSFFNIAQAAERVRKGYGNHARHNLSVCCTPAFSALWLAPRLPDFFSSNPDIDLDLITTQNFLALEPGVHPDIFITKTARVRDGYINRTLFSDRIYPVCTPRYLAEHPEIGTLEGLKNGVLLNLSPHGRSQVAEHVDWGVWLAIFHLSIDDPARRNAHCFKANDYSLLIQMALDHQGVALGFHHLVAPLLEKGLLVRPLEQELSLEETRHYFASREDKAGDNAMNRFQAWFFTQSDEPAPPA